MQGENFPLQIKKENRQIHNELPIYKDVYRLVLLLFRLTNNFSKDYKFTLGQDIKRDAIELTRCIYRVNRAEKKGDYFEDFLDNFELLKTELRLSKNLKLFSIKQFPEMDGRKTSQSI